MWHATWTWRHIGCPCAALDTTWQPIGRHLVPLSLAEACCTSFLSLSFFMMRSLMHGSHLVDCFLPHFSLTLANPCHLASPYPLPNQPKICRNDGNHWHESNDEGKWCMCAICPLSSSTQLPHLISLRLTTLLSHSLSFSSLTLSALTLSVTLSLIRLSLSWIALSLARSLARRYPRPTKHPASSGAPQPTLDPPLSLIRGK